MARKRKRSIRRGLAYNIGGNLTFFVILFGSSVVLARLLTPSEMGVYAVTMSVYYLLEGLLRVGLTAYVVREKELPPEKLGSVFALTFIKCVVFGLIVYGLSYPAGAFSRDDRVTHSIQILAVTAAIVPILNPLVGLRARNYAFGLSTLMMLLRTVVATGATLALAYSGAGYTSMPWGNAIGAVVVVATSLAIQWREIQVPLGFVYAREVLKFGQRIFVTSLITSTANRMPDLILMRVLGAAATGLYNRGAGLVDIFGNTLMRSFLKVQAAKLRRDRDTPKGIGPAYALMKRGLTAIFWPGFAVAGVLASPLIGLLYGRQWLDAAPLFSIMLFATAVGLTVSGRQNVYITLGREKELPKNELIRALIGVSLFWIAVPFGLVWAAATRVVDAFVSMVLYMPGLRQGTGVGYRRLVQECAPSAAITAVTVAPAAGYMTWLNWPATLDAPEMAAVLVVCALAWLGAVFAIRHDVADEIRLLVKPVLAKVGLR